MYKISTGLLLLLTLISYQLSAQFLPKEGSELNYRLIGFLSPGGQPHCKYTIEIATGTYNNEDSFKQNIIKSIPGNSNKIIGEVPSFGSQYTWRTVIKGTDSKITTGALHHFSTQIIPEVDTNLTRLRIIDNTGKYKNDYVFIDGSRALYDMNGQPLWFLPTQKDTTLNRARNILRHVPGGDMTFDNGTRDLKCSPWGTLTFLDTNKLYEINYNGDILWKSPDIKAKDSVAEIIGNYYHHEFTRLANGHYMSLGIAVLRLELTPEMAVNIPPKIHIGIHSEITRDSVTNKLYQQTMTGRIVEMDEKGDIVWSWKLADYLKQSDLYNRRRKNGMFRLNNTHENAFFFDEKDKVIYISFRNINRIIKIEYPSGKVLNTYGALYEPGIEELNNDLFCGQHSCRRSMDGYLYMYNNNTCNAPCNFPTILMLQEPHSNKEHLKKVWEYECVLDTAIDQTPKKLRFGLGGNVFELPDRAIFCSMGYNYSRTFIVNRDKKILWSAMPEAWDKNANKWMPLSSYRASIISRKDLESLIWAEHLKN